MRSNWTLGKKLGFGFAMMTAVTAVLGVLAILWMADLRRSSERATVESEDVIEVMHLQALAEREQAEARGYLISRDETLVREMHDLDAQGDTLVQQRLAHVDTAEGRRLIAEIQAADQAVGDGVERFVTRHRAEAQSKEARYVEELGKALDTEERPLVDRLRKALAAYADYERSGRDEESARFRQTAERINRWMIGLVLLSVALGIAFAVTFARSVTRDIGAAVQNVQSSSAELQAAATQQAAAAKEQAAATNETTTTIKELVATARQIAEGAQRVSQVAERTSGGAREGDQAARRAHGALGEIKRQVDALVAQMLDLGKRSQQIGGILEIINELTEQTNILAINATIEAAGAGESGKRFAIVADEIRKLADRVGGSSKDIRALIEEVRAAVNSTVMATEQGSKAVDAGARQVGELAQSFGQIATLIGTTTEAAREIELSTRQQTTAVEQVNVAMADVSQASRETEATAAQMFDTASQLATLSKSLSRMVRQER
jgi:CHASE3 domain sensor protein